MVNDGPEVAHDEDRLAMPVRGRGRVDEGGCGLITSVLAVARAIKRAGHTIVALFIGKRS